MPPVVARTDLVGRCHYGPYAKHKYNPGAYRLKPYEGGDEERTYCDEHAKFGKADFARIPDLLERGIMLGLWGEHSLGEDPAMLWTIDDNGWIYELRITNAVQAEYHGYPVLEGDAFAQQVITRARRVASSPEDSGLQAVKNAQAAIAAAQAMYK